MPKVLIFYLCALLCLIPTHSALLKDLSNIDSVAQNPFLPHAHSKSVEDMVSSILESPELPFVENELTATISPEEAKEHDKQIQQEVIANLEDPQNNKGPQGDPQNNQINKKIAKKDTTPNKNGDLGNIKDSQQIEPIAPQDSSTVHSDIIEPHPSELSLEALHMFVAPECSADNETCAMELGHSNEGNSFGSQPLPETSETVNAKNNIDAEFEKAQEQIANEILGSGERLEKSLETVANNLGTSSLVSVNKKSGMGKLKKSDASEKTQEKSVENSQENPGASPVGQKEQGGKSHSRDIFVQTSQGDDYFHKGPIFILGIGIVIVIVLAFRMMTEHIDDKIQEYEEERDSLMTSKTG